MHIRVLGSVEVTDEAGSVVSVRGPMPSRLLALLVAARSEMVEVDELAVRMWEGLDLPDDPVASLRTYVARARSVAGPAAIITGNAAYSLGDVETDARQFESFVQRARQAGTSPAALELWDAAVALWRGPAFGDLADLEGIRSEALRLEELRAEATEAAFEHRLGAGQVREVAADIGAAIEQFPLREGLRAQQMTALAGAGRQVEALRVFQDFRADLTEVGLQPSEDLAALDRRIAGGDVPKPGGTRHVRGYEIGERLGEGAFALVHRGTQSSIGRSVAIKQIRQNLADQPEFIRQFEFEAQLIARLEHPNIVPLYDFWREPGSAYLVMRYLDGGTLGGKILDDAAPLDDVVRWVSQVAAALDEAHRSGVIHRDVKPANILLDHSGNAYLSDFGIAVEEAERVDPAAWLSNGSPAYAPPEQLLREPVGATADVFALAVTVYEALAGRLPFPGETSVASLLDRQLNEPIPLIRVSNPEVPSAVDAVVQRATAKDPNDRYESAGQFAVALAAAAGIDTQSEIEPEDRNPYKGLRAFDEADARDFAGRDRLVSQLVDTVAEHRAIFVVGPSGSGKSSAVRAGLIPSIRNGRIPGSDRWFVSTMIPGADPFADLEAAIMRIAVDPPADVLGTLRNENKGLARTIRRLVPEDREFVLVIDQFEELFTLTKESDRRRFLDLLVEAITDDGSRLRLVATLRADFFDHPLRHPAFADVIEPATVAVHPLAADELERVITEPARAVGATFEAGLIARITADVADEPGALPLLQYALTELFESREDHRMTIAAYEELGGVAGALARRAEIVFSESPTDRQLATRRIFGRLVSLGEGTEDTRRRAVRAELGDDAAVDQVLVAFGQARLFSFDRDRVTRDAIVEVAHEALIREWPRLRRWLDEDRDGLRVLRHLNEASAGWDEQGRVDSELYRGGRLETAAAWALDHPADMQPVEAEFLEASTDLETADEAAEQSATRRLRRLLAGVAVVAVVAMVAGLLAFQQRGAANENAAAAETERIAADAANLAGRDLPLSLLLGVEAHHRDPGPVGLGALQQSLANAGSFLGQVPLDGARSVRWLDNDRLIVVGPEGLWLFDRAGEIEQLSDVAVYEWSRDVWDGNRIARSLFDTSASAVAIGRADDRLIVELVDLDDGDVRSLRFGASVDALELSDDGSTLFTLDLDGWLTATEVETGRKRWTILAHPEEIQDDLNFPEGTVESAFGLPWQGSEASLNGYPQLLKLDEAGSRIVSVEGPMIRQWSLETGGSVAEDLLLRYNGPESLAGPVAATVIADLDLEPDGLGFVSTALIGLGDGTFAADPAAHYRAIDTSAVFYGQPKADLSWWGGGDEVLVLFTDGRLGTVDRATGSLFDELRTGLTSVSDFAVSPDGAVVAFASNEGLGFWSRSGDGLIASGISREGTHVAHLIDADTVAASYSQLAVSGWQPSIWWDVSGAVPARVDTPTDELIPTWGTGFRFNENLFGSFDFSTQSTLWDVETRLPVVTLVMPGSWSGQAASPDGMLGAYGTASVGGLTVYSVPDGAPLALLEEPGDSATSMSFSADSSVLATVGEDQLLRLYSTESWDLLEVPAIEGSTARAVDFSPDGQFLVVLADNGDIVVRNTDDYEIIKTIVGPGRDTVTDSDGFFFDESGRYLITSSGRLWDLDEGVQVGVAFPNAPDFRIGGKDGFELLTAVDDHILRWNLNFEEWPDIACQAAGRNMTLNEWEQFGPAGADYRATCPQWPSNADLD